MNYGDVKECSKCHSNNIKVVKYIIKNGRIQYRHQCMDCGYLDSASIKYNSIPKNVDIPLVNDKLRECYYDSNITQDGSFPVVIYENYIVSDEWYQKRELIFGIKGKKCAICGVKNNIVIHHLNYDSLGHEEYNNFADVISLCKDCHKKMHDYLEKNNDTLRTLKADLCNLRNSYLFNYHNDINKTVYKYTKDLKWHSEIAMRIYLETLYGKYKCNKNIYPYFDSEKVLVKIIEGDK